MNIESLYRAATSHSPYPYQARLAMRDEWPQVLSVPTGVGKTAAAILSWLFRRRFAAAEVQKATPRRLVYCLPMRTLVEQTRDVAERWLSNLGLAGSEPENVGVYLLMGGADDRQWYKYPERDAILIGTQDMLLSRALNRGYGMSRYQWPVQFALLNNDALWVLDETQLMGVGLTTSAQMEGFRKSLNTYGECRTIWMSATLDDEALVTVDHPKPIPHGWLTEELKNDDRSVEPMVRLLTAAKPCRMAGVTLNSELETTYTAQLAEAVIAAHRDGTLTLVVMNRVKRAQDVFAMIERSLSDTETAPDVVLIHSRFRSADRQVTQATALNEDTIPAAGRIIVTTQAIEAGVDVSATTLFTELAPWSSLVQRFGRCNRRGACGMNGAPSAQVFWSDIETTAPRRSSGFALPYEPEELDRARAAVATLEDVGPQSLAGVTVEESRPVVHVIRRKDLFDLFDTTPDLSGNDLDVSRYIRESEDTDVQVYWRAWNVADREPPRPQKTPGSIDFPAPQRDELCAAPVGQFRAFFSKLRKNDKTKRTAWIWDPLVETWQPCDESLIRPGQLILLHKITGGYDERLGWTGETKHQPVEPVPPPKVDEQLPEAMSQEDLQGSGELLIIEEHLREVGHAAILLPESLDVGEALPWEAIIRAAWWHDVGKAHPAFQGAMRAACESLDADKLWAKSGVSGYLKYQIPSPKGDGRPTLRPGFRHELASALAWLRQHDGEPQADLVAYLVAAHHGKVRLSIRSMPNEAPPPENVRDILFARGIWHGDRLPRVEIGNGDVSEAIDGLDLRLMQLGEYQDSNGAARPSWLARTLALREEHGPFKLAYLETLVRIADWRGSAGKKPASL